MARRACLERSGGAEQQARETRNNSAWKSKRIYKKIAGIHVSLSHINNFANAFVIIEKF